MAKQVIEVPEVPDVVVPPSEKSNLDLMDSSGTLPVGVGEDPVTRLLHSKLVSPDQPRLDSLRTLLGDLGLTPDDLRQMLLSRSAVESRSSDVTQLFTITVDGILRPDGDGEWRGRVTRGELESAGANVDWLIQSGALVDEGFVRQGV